MPKIKIHQPQAYDRIKPLHGSAGQPIRCAPIVIPDIEDRPDCANCPSKNCRATKCDQQ